MNTFIQKVGLYLFIFDTTLFLQISSCDLIYFVESFCFFIQER